MKIAACQSVTLGDVRLILSPTLGAAINLHREFRGIQKLAEAIADESLTAISAVIREHHPGEANIESRVLQSGTATFVRPLIEHLTWLAGTGPKTEQEREEDLYAPRRGKTITLDEWYQELFSIGTGWIGWTAQETMDTAPSDILLALEGRLSFMKSIFGSGESSGRKKGPPTGA